MDRLTGRGAKSLKEAYAKVYIQEQVPDYASMSDAEFAELVKKSGNPEGLIAKRMQQKEVAANEKSRLSYTADDAKRDQEAAKIKAENERRASKGQTALPSGSAKSSQTYTINGKTYSSKAEINKEYDRLRNSGQDTKAFGNAAFKATNRPATATTPGGTKFERRTPTSAELKAAQAARAAGKGEEAALKAAVNAGKTNTSSGSVKQEVDAVKSNISANQQSSVQSAVKSGVQKAGVKVGDTVKTKVNPDSSMSVTQRRSAAATDKIKKSLDIQSADLFDIVKAEFINEGYSEEDTMYMMANLNEEQLQEFLKKIIIDPLIRAGRPLVTKGLQRVGRMFGRSPKPTAGTSAISQRASNVVKDQRLGVHGTMDDLNQLQRSAQSSLDKLSKSKAKDATRAATREKTRLNNLDPRAVSDRNAREAASQVMQRNRELGRPSWAPSQPVDRLDYKPGDPMFTDALKRYYRQKREGIRGLPD